MEPLAARAPPITSPARCGPTLPAPRSTPLQGNDAGANDESFACQPGGTNAPFGDVGVKFLEETITSFVLLGLVTIKGDAVLSANSS